MAPSSSFLLLFLLSSVMLMMLAAAAADGQGEEQEPACPTVPCGGVNISFPFAIVTDEARETSCGLIGFQVMCLNSTPYLGYKNRFYGNQFQILDIFYHNASLLVADVHKAQDFKSPASEGCHAPKDNSSNKLGLPFSVSPINRQSLIFYNCMEPPLPEKAWRREGLVEMPCGNKTFARVAERTAVESSGSYGGYFLEGCNATVVPALARYGEANASDYRELISEGFLLTWQVPSTPPSSGTPHGPS